MTRRAASLLLAAAGALPAAAQTITQIQVDPATAQTGQPVTITATFADAATPNCNVRVNFGDGATHDFKINQAKDVPLVTRRTYDKPGTYRVRVEGKTALPTLKCLGKTQSALVTVVAGPAPAAVPARAQAAAVGAPMCPEGWRLDPKSIDPKTGAFTCSARPGTALPLTHADCPGTLTYFENRTRARLGCRP